MGVEGGLDRDVPPLPAWPAWSFPQQYRAPTVDTAHVCALHAATAAMPVIVGSVGRPGTQAHPVALVYPSPSVPNRFVPQQYRAPAAVTAHVCAYPVEMVATVTNPDTAVGVDTSVVAPVPN